MNAQRREMEYFDEAWHRENIFRIAFSHADCGASRTHSSLKLLLSFRSFQVHRAETSGAHQDIPRCRACPLQTRPPALKIYFRLRRTSFRSKLPPSTASGYCPLDLPPSGFSSARISCLDLVLGSPSVSHHLFTATSRYDECGQRRVDSPLRRPYH